MFIQSLRSRLTIGDVVKVDATEKQGLHIKHLDGEVMVDPNGNYVTVYTAPVDPEVIPFQEVTGGLRKQGKGGNTYTQHILDAPDVKEGERVEKYGTVEAAPKPVNKSRTSPLQFYLLVSHPEHEREQERLEVYSTKAAKQKLQGYKLVQGDKIHAILYKHTWTDQTIGGDQIVSIRYNLTAITGIERKREERSAQRSTRRTAETQQ